MSAIDFSLLTKGEVRSLSGHDRGLAARTRFNLDTLDSNADPIPVVAPTNLDAMTPSFVQGLFAASIHGLGPERFFSHYNFQLPEHLLTDVRIGVDRVLMQRKIAGT